MYCPECGIAAENHFRFCKECGAGLGSGTSPKLHQVVDGERMEVHVKLLGWLLIGSAVLTGLTSTLVFMAGGLMRVVPIPVEVEPMLGMDLGPVVSIIVLITAATILAVAGLSIAAGVGILSYQSWGRVMTLIAASLLMFKFPLGTAVGIYAFWVLLSEEGKKHYKTHAPQPA